MISKKYVDVVVFWQVENANLTPLFIVENTIKYKIDKILDKRQLASSAGGCGIRYQCRIQDKIVNLFYEGLTNTWFYEYEILK